MKAICYNLGSDKIWILSTILNCWIEEIFKMKNGMKFFILKRKIAIEIKFPACKKGNLYAEDECFHSNQPIPTRKWRHILWFFNAKHTKII